MTTMGLKETIEWYDQNAAAYATLIRDKFSYDQLLDFKKQLAPGAKILDAGSAGGRDSNLFHQEGFDITGIDLSSGLIGYAKRAYPAINFVQGDFTATQLADDSMDGIWAHASLVHMDTVDDTIQAIAEFERILKPRGILHVVVHAKVGVNDTAVVSDKFSNHERFFRYYAQKELVGYLTDAGFEIDKASQYSEIDRNSNGRSEVAWIYILGRKIEQQGKNSNG